MPASPVTRTAYALAHASFRAGRRSISPYEFQSSEYRSPSRTEGSASESISSDENQSKEPPRPPKTCGEFLGALLSSSDGRDKPLKVIKGSLGLTHLFARDFGGDPITLRRLSLVQEKISTTRNIVGLLGVPLEVRHGYLAFLEVENHFSHLKGWTNADAAREKKYEREYPKTIGKSLGLLAQIFKMLEKVAHIIAYGICGFELFIESCVEGQVSQSAKSLGKKFSIFAMALHFCNFATNICDFIRKGFFSLVKSEDKSQIAWAGEMKDLSLKLIENICDLIIDALLIASVAVLANGYLIATLALVAASVGLWRLLSKTEVAEIIPLEAKPILVRA